MSEPVKVVIEVKGGYVVAVLSGIDLDVRIVDYDNQEDGDPVLGRMFSDDTFVGDFMRGSATKDFL